MLNCSLTVFFSNGLNVSSELLYIKQKSLCSFDCLLLNMAFVNVRKKPHKWDMHTNTSFPYCYLQLLTALIVLMISESFTCFRNEIDCIPVRKYYLNPLVMTVHFFFLNKRPYN